MVESTKTNNPLNPTGKPELDDIFAEEDEKPVSIPLADTNQTENNISKQGALPETTMSYGEEGSDILGKIRKYLVIGLVVLIVVVVVIIIAWYRQSILGWVEQLNFFVGKNTPAAITNQPKINQNQNTNQVTANNTGANNLAPNKVTQQINGKIDSDGDGLTDEEEAVLGTNPHSVDTDNDGLFDREEVKVYHTDPLNPDTDGDGYKDGYEVMHHMNPRGTGTLEQMTKQ